MTGEMEIDNPILSQGSEFNIPETEEKKNENQAFLIAYGMVCLYLLYRAYTYFKPPEDRFGFFTSSDTSSMWQGGGGVVDGPIRVGFNNVNSVLSELTFE
jgi:hypothetical protein